MSNELQKIRRNDLPLGVRRFFDWLMDSAKNVLNGIDVRRHPATDVYFLDYVFSIPIVYGSKKEQYPFRISIRIEVLHEGLCILTFTSSVAAFCIGNAEILTHLKDIGFFVNKLNDEGQLFKIYLVLGDKFLFRVGLDKRNGDFGPIDVIEASQVVFANDMETFLTNLNLFENAIAKLTQLFTGAIDRIQIKPWFPPMKERQGSSSDDDLGGDITI